MHTEQRIALVIGASSKGGLGEAAARRLRADGFELIVAGRRMGSLTALAGEIGGRALPVDMLDEASIAALIAGAGRIDVVVNAAGTAVASSILKIAREQIEAQFGMHVTANILLMKYAAPVMPRGGSIVLFSSITATLAGPGLAAYAAAKAGLDQVVRVAALEFGALGVRVNAVAPGFTRTPMTEAFLSNPRFDAMYRREAAMGALAIPGQVAAAVSYLVAADCFTTGEIIHVSGGAQLGRMPRADEIRDEIRA